MYTHCNCRKKICLTLEDIKVDPVCFCKHHVLKVDVPSSFESAIYTSDLAALNLATKICLPPSCCSLCTCFERVRVERGLAMSILFDHVAVIKQ